MAVNDYVYGLQSILEYCIINSLTRLAITIRRGLIVVGVQLYHKRESQTRQEVVETRYTSAEDDPATSDPLTVALSSVHSLLGRFSHASTEELNRTSVAATSQATGRPTPSRHDLAAKSSVDRRIGSDGGRGYTNTYNEYTLADIRKYADEATPTNIEATPTNIEATPPAISKNSVKWVDDKERRVEQVKQELLQQKETEATELHLKEVERAARSSLYTNTHTHTHTHIHTHTHTHKHTRTHTYTHTYTHTHT